MQHKPNIDRLVALYMPITSDDEEREHVSVPSKDEVKGYMPLALAVTNPETQSVSREALINVFRDGVAQMPTNRTIYPIIKSIYDAQKGAGGWQIKSGVSKFSETLDGGQMEVSMVKGQEQSELGAYVYQLDDLAVDVLVISLTQWLHTARTYNESVMVYIDSVLDYRGIKPKSKGNYSAGHRDSDRQEIISRFELLDKIFLQVIGLTVYHPGKRMPSKVSLQSKVLAITDRIVENGKPIAYKVTTGEYGRLLYGENGKQTGLLFQQILKYDYYRHDWEKRIGMYLTFQWAIRKAHGNLNQPFRVATILDNIREPLNLRFPNRTRERFESALAQLKIDGIIEDWGYDRGNGEVLPARKWINQWLSWTVLLTAPAVIVDRYKSVQDSRNKILERNKRGKNLA